MTTPVTLSPHDAKSASRGVRVMVVGIENASGILTKGNARLNPVKACHGSLKAATRKGARVFERSEVRPVRRIDEGVRLYCPNGTIDATQVMIATGYATKYFRPLAGRFRMRRTYVLATDRINARVRRRLGLNDVHGNYVSTSTRCCRRCGRSASRQRGKACSR